MVLFFILDTISTIFLITVTLIRIRILFFRKSYINKDKSNKKFYFLLLLFVFRIYLLILSPNNLSILLGWDGLGISSYLLVIYYNSNKANTSGMLTLLINRLGDALILTALYLQINRHSWSTQEIILSKKIKIFMIFFIIGLMTKSAQIPFSSWLPAAMAAPTPVSSLVHSSTLVTAGIYLIIRINLAFRKIGINQPLIILGRTTALIARLRALKENDIKKVVALSTLRQLGFMVAILGLNCWFLAFTHLINHAFFKALLFVATGNIIHSSRDSQDLKLTSQKNYQIFNSLIIVFLTTLRITGITFLRAFYAKETLLENIFLNNHSRIIILIFITNICLTPIYALRSIVIFYFLIVKQLTKTYAENKDSLINLRTLLLSCPALVSGFLINKNFSIKEQSSFSPLIYCALATIILFIVIGIILYFKKRKILKLKLRNVFNLTIWGLRVTFIKWLPKPGVNLINKPSAEEKKLLVRAFNFIFHEFKFSAQTSKIFLQHILVLVFIRLISIILYYLNNIILKIITWKKSLLVLLKRNVFLHYKN